jgi:acyl-CoA thioester hydrolase
MSSPLPTLQGTVNTWHCDEVGHMNVQFYVAAGADATRAYGVAKGVMGPIVSDSDHVRFHRELRAGDIFTCQTYVVGAEKRGLILAHEIYNQGTNALAATIVSRTTLKFSGIENVFGQLNELARPRSIGDQSRLPKLHLTDAVAEQLIPIYQGVVHAEHCDETGDMRQQFIMARFSDGAAHLWHHVGFDRETMLNARRGTVVLEIRIDRLADIAPGTVLIAKSAIVGVEGKVLTFAHFLFDGATGNLVASGEAAAVLLDLDARKTVAFGDAERAGIDPYIMRF